MFRALALALVLACLPAAAATGLSTEALIRQQLDKYLASRGRTEHISAAAVAVSLPGAASNINAAAGTTTYGGHVVAQPAELVQIGSNTKAFTAVALLQLEAQGELSIDDPIGRWLPEYPAWKRVTIRQLLNMTSGIPTYDTSDRLLSAYARDPYRNLTAAQVIAYVYPKVDFAPGARWSYTNTAYLLAQLIIERITGDSYTHEMRQRFFTPLHLSSTFYSGGVYAVPVLMRMPAGYFYNHSPANAPLKPLLGRDVKGMSMSWAQGAGAIVASLDDLTRWVRALYRGPLLAAPQRAELVSIVSLNTGKPIAHTTLTDPRGFGLGVGQLTRPREGTFWYYEGESLGYRTLYAYLPTRDAVLAVTLNSQPTDGEDRIGTLLDDIYTALHATGIL